MGRLDCSVEVDDDDNIGHGGVCGKQLGPWLFAHLGAVLLAEFAALLSQMKSVYGLGALPRPLEEHDVSVDEEI